MINNDTLTDKDIKELARLGKSIRLGLECDVNGHGIPCRTDRFTVVEAMKGYLEIHDLEVIKL
jgi:hypothetical protein